MSLKPFLCSKTSQWLSTNYLTEYKHLILTVKDRGAPGGHSSISFQSPINICRFQPVCGMWPIHRASVKNSDESKMSSYLQSIKLAGCSFIDAGRLHETLEQRQRKADCSMQNYEQSIVILGSSSSGPTSRRLTQRARQY